MDLLVDYCRSLTDLAVARGYFFKTIYRPDVIALMAQLARAQVSYLCMTRVKSRAILRSQVRALLRAVCFLFCPTARPWKTNLENMA